MSDLTIGVDCLSNITRYGNIRSKIIKSMHMCTEFLCGFDCVLRLFSMG